MGIGFTVWIVYIFGPGWAFLTCFMTLGGFLMAFEKDISSKTQIMNNPMTIHNKFVHRT
jgi:hypothetical protein